MASAHHKFAGELDSQCGQGGGGTQKHLWAAIVRILDQVVRFCSADKTSSEARRALEMSSLSRAQSQAQVRHLSEQAKAARSVMHDAAQQFKQLLIYLLRILHAATLKARSRHEFEELLHRINHNGHYNELLLGLEAG